MEVAIKCEKCGKYVESDRDNFYSVHIGYAGTRKEGASFRLTSKHIKSVYICGDCIDKTGLLEEESK